MGLKAPLLHIPWPCVSLSFENQPSLFGGADIRLQVCCRSRSVRLFNHAWASLLVCTMWDVSIGLDRIDSRVPK